MSIRSTSLFDTGTRMEPFLVLFTTLRLSTLSSILSRKDLEGAPSPVIWEQMSSRRWNKSSEYTS